MLSGQRRGALCRPSALQHGRCGPSDLAFGLGLSSPEPTHPPGPAQGLPTAPCTPTTAAPPQERSGATPAVSTAQAAEVYLSVLINRNHQNTTGFYRTLLTATHPAKPVTGIASPISTPSPRSGMGVGAVAPTLRGTGCDEKCQGSEQDAHSEAHSPGQWSPASGADRPSSLESSQTCSSLLSFLTAAKAASQGLADRGPLAWEPHRSRLRPVSRPKVPAEPRVGGAARPGRCQEPLPADRPTGSAQKRHKTDRFPA